jgi:peptidoglycan hydrolase CwlO-like protein
MRIGMKRKSTTSTRSSNRMTRLSLGVISFAMAIATPIAYVQNALADQWDNQISSLQAQANQYQSQADQLRAQGDTLQNKLNIINAEVSALQSQIQVNQAKHDKLQADITANQKKLQDTQDTLGNMLASLYVDDKVSEVELLASSKNISDYVDKQEYRSSVRDQLNTTIADVKKIKAQLESDNKAVEKVLADLDVQNKQLSATQADQQSLVNQTRGEEAQYQQLVSNARSALSSVLAQQQAYYASLISRGAGNAGVVGSFNYWGWSGNQGCGGGGYPYCGSQDTSVDPWNLYNRECVSYVAWALQARFGKSVSAFHGDGNAMDWPYSAPRWSGAYRVSAPVRGDAVILPAMGGFAPIGHAMIVESVSGDSVFVSQYNMYGTGQYSTMWIKTSGVIFLRFPNA